MAQQHELEAYRAEVAELRVLLDKVRADVNKEREVNAVQTATIVALIHLNEQHRDELAHTPAAKEFYENQWKRLLALGRELYPDVHRAAVEGGGSGA